MRVRVVVYNVRGFRDGFERLVRLVGHFEPDVVLLNETGSRWRLGRFAKALGMGVARDPWSPFRRRVKDAVLVRPPWWIAEHRQQRFEATPLMYPRGALIARLENGDAGLCAVSTHLGLHPRERLADARELERIVADAGTPVVIGGDLNERPDGRAVGYLSEHLRDAWLLGGDVDELGGAIRLPEAGAPRSEDGPAAAGVVAGATRADAVALDRAFDQRLQRARVGHVGGGHFGLAAARQDLVDHGLRVAAPRRRDNGGAAACELGRNRAADTARRTRHDCHLSVERCHELVSLQRAPAARAANSAATSARSSGLSRCAKLASRAILRPRPIRTEPGPTSTNAVAPSLTMRRITSSQRTGADT